MSGSLLRSSLPYAMYRELLSVTGDGNRAVMSIRMLRSSRKCSKVELVPR